MSQAPQNQDSGHEGPIKTPKQLIVAVALAFVVPVAIIALLVSYVKAGSKGSSGSDALSPQAVSERIMPIGKVEIKAASANTGPRSGEEVYKAQCASCHGAGALGAPKFSDAGAWGPRIGAGVDALVNSALKGKNAMPAQGGGDYSDLEVHRAVVYMANAGGAKFTEPAAPAAAASAP
ncbi:MAG: c-type cytochrome [Aquabacterium sp.]